MKLSRGFDDSGSVFAREGTAAHHLAERCLHWRVDASDYRGHVIDATGGGNIFAHGAVEADGDTRFEVTAEMVDAVQIYLDVVRELIADGYEMEFEQRLTTPISDGVFGTGDAVGYHPHMQRVAIVDLKYGKGVVVEPEGNEQLLTYAAGVAMRHHNRGVDDALLMIVQPRAPHPRGPKRGCFVTAMELEAHVEKAKAALDSDELRPGPWCKFCPAAGFCAALQYRVADAMGAIYKKGLMVGTDNPETYESERLAHALAERELVAGWLKSVDRLAHNQGMKGEPPTGWKMVYANSHRKFKNPSDAVQMLGLYGLTREEMFEPEQLRSPAQLEKELPKQARRIMATLTHSPKTKLILVSEDDPRPSIDPNSVDGFEDFAFEGEEE